ncbi:hypothetical protein HZA33_00790 [Candidatus Pacearchaeota archaeon]|nr:hypothetical protein [Candidatus Pacearchaeota archaeon]
MEEEQEISVCQKCYGKGIVHEKDGSTHTCWDCLANGKLDAHSEKVKDSGIQI